MKMYLGNNVLTLISLMFLHLAQAIPQDLTEIQQPATNNFSALFSSLEEQARLAGIAYCVGQDHEGNEHNISTPFTCNSRCNTFPDVRLLDVWQTEKAESSGYIAIEHAKKRIIVAHRGAINWKNWVVCLSTAPQQFTPYPSEPLSNPPPAGNPVPEPVPQEAPKEEESGWWTRFCNWVAKVSRVIKALVVNTFTKNPDETRDGNADEHDPALDGDGRCINCTVHGGFYEAYKEARTIIIPKLEEMKTNYPDYDVQLIGHSMGGGILPFVGLECQERGWNPRVTIFGSPRIGNMAFNNYLNAKFGLSSHERTDVNSRLRRVTHLNDPIPLLPPREWGYHMFAGEIFISKEKLPFTEVDLVLCVGDEDPACSARMENERGYVVKGIMKILTSIQAGLNEWYSSDDDKDAIENLERRGLVDDPLPDLGRFTLLKRNIFSHNEFFWRLGRCESNEQVAQWEIDHDV